MKQETLYDSAQLGVLSLSLVPEKSCGFRASPALSLRASLLRRLELFDPELSAALHGAPGTYSNVRPWTISPLLGPLSRQRQLLVAEPEKPYRVRITGLTQPILELLNAAFFSEHPLAREPLILEHVPFHIVAGQSSWQSPTAYARLLTESRPVPRIALRFLSPASFRRREGNIILPAPRTCLTGYVRKWNSFSDVLLPEGEILNYAENYIVVSQQNLRPAIVKSEGFTIQGVRGIVEWTAKENSAPLLRLVNALVDYAFYCGTGILTAQGMGQTVRATARGTERNV